MQVVGFSKFVSSKGVNCCFLNVVYPPRANDSRTVGMCVEQLFIPEAVAPKVTNSIVDKNIDLVYEVVSGRAYIVDIKVV